jgi:hypothetical protein
MLRTLHRLERLLEIAESEGIQIRREWLGGVRGGLVRLGAFPILFVDESLTVPEQWDQAKKSLGQLDWSETECGQEVVSLLQDSDEASFS